MFFSNFIYIIKRVLSSPAVIGIVIVALLYLSLVFYILNYKKKKSKPVQKEEKKIEQTEEETKDSDEETSEK